MLSSAFPLATDEYTGVCCSLYRKCLRWLGRDAYEKVGVLVRRSNLQSACCCFSQVEGSGATPWQGRGLSGGQGLNVLEHLLKGLWGWCIRIPEGGLDPAVQAEGLQLQPDEPEAVVVEQDEDAGGALGAGEAVASDEARAVETEQRGKAGGREG